MFEAELAELDAIDPSQNSVDSVRERVHASMRAKAAGDPKRLEHWVGNLDPADPVGSNRLADIYEALAPDVSTLSSFFINELERLLDVCKKLPRSKEAFSALGMLMFLEKHASGGVRDALLGRLVEEIRSPIPSVRRACVDLAGGLSIDRDPVARRAVEASLSDSDWRVRALAESSLEGAGVLPPDYKPSLLDRVRRKLFSWTDYV